jgi:hypothetical protein
MLIKEQCGTDLDQCEEDLEEKGYKVFNPAETQSSCENNESIQCLQTAFSSLSSKMSVSSVGNSMNDCYVLLKGSALTNGSPTIYITTYADGQIIISYLLNENNNNKKLLYRGKYTCNGGSIEVKGGSTFKFIGVRSGQGADFKNDFFLNSSGIPYEINNSQSAIMGIPTGPLKYENVLTFYLNKKNLYVGNVLDKGLSNSQLLTLISHT